MYRRIDVLEHISEASTHAGVWEPCWEIRDRVLLLRGSAVFFLLQGTSPSKGFESPSAQSTQPSKEVLWWLLTSISLPTANYFFLLGAYTKHLPLLEKSSKCTQQERHSPG